MCTAYLSLCPKSLSLQCPSISSPFPTPHFNKRTGKTGKMEYLDQEICLLVLVKIKVDPLKLMKSEDSLGSSFPCSFHKSNLSFETDSLASVTWVRSNRDKIFTFYLQEVKIPSCSRQPQEGLSCHHLSAQSWFLQNSDGEFLKIVIASLEE